MNDFIMVPILCNSEEAIKLKEMGIKVDEDRENEFRASYLRKSAIIGFYPLSNGGCSIELINGTALETDIKFKDLVKIMFA
ncbi:hypothetical protein [Runella salmonicolor]|uniref:Uncharacterized protein n=1 Tax=Runella salmonicolor TaxID=2950278 RepID=A0ABT1FSR9_9BACT|nr:hypothetical protein [Runella salmonicolor]MCP1384807.1 hypothetical protein [Runella salmonicolor]